MTEGTARKTEKNGVISDFGRGVKEIFGLLGRYTA
jgi:hypothetical protein